jgi:Domain of unknown function (DUF4468) with TBP-like fold
MRNLIFILVICANTFTAAQILAQSDARAEEKELLQSYLNNFDRDDSRRYFIQDVVHADGKTKDQLFIELKIWITLHFSEVGYELLADDAGAGILVARGWTDPIVSDDSTTTSLAYSIKFEIRDGKYRFRVFHVDFSIQDANSSVAGTGTLTDLINKSYTEDCKIEVNANYSDVATALQSIIEVKESLTNAEVEFLSSGSHR